MSILMITIETENYNLISQDFYDKTINSIDLTLIPCTCGHSGCLIRHGSYKRRIQLTDQILTLTIVRVFCNVCGHTHALLLSSMVPYSQIPLHTQYDAVLAFEEHGDLSSVLTKHCFVDENNLRSILRNYRHCWQQRLLSFSLQLPSLSSLVQECFSLFSRQFMQIKRTWNHLFILPT